MITRIGAAVAALIWIAPEPARDAAAHLPRSAEELQAAGAAAAIGAALEFCRLKPEKCAAAAAAGAARAKPEKKPQAARKQQPAA